MSIVNKMQLPPKGEMIQINNLQKSTMCILYKNVSIYVCIFLGQFDGMWVDEVKISGWGYII